MNLLLYVDSEFRNTGLERSESLAKDLKWFKQEGHTIPEPSPPGVSYSLYLKELSEKDPQAFLCHYYNFYLAHTAGGRMIGKKVELYCSIVELYFETEALFDWLLISYDLTALGSSAHLLLICSLAATRSECQ